MVDVQTAAAADVGPLIEWQDDSVKMAQFQSQLHTLGATSPNYEQSQWLPPPPKNIGVKVKVTPILGNFPVRGEKALD